MLPTCTSLNTGEKSLVQQIGLIRQATWVGKPHLKKKMATHFNILAWRIPMDRGAWQATIHGAAESDSTEQLSTAQIYTND